MPDTPDTTAEPATAARPGGHDRDGGNDHDSAAEVAAELAVTGATLFAADVAMRAGTRLLRHVIERRMLKGRYGVEEAAEILDSRGLRHAALATGLSRLMTRSVPGALVVGGGLVAKTLFDKSQQRRRGQRRARREKS